MARAHESEAGAGGWQARGTALAVVAVLFLLFDTSGKLLEAAPVVERYPDHAISALGVVLLLAVIIHAVPVLRRQV